MCRMLREMRAMFRLQERLEDERPGWGYTDFVVAFAGEAIPEAIPRETYRMFSNELARHAGFPVSAADDLVGVYGIESLGSILLEEIIEEILDRAGLKRLRSVPQDRDPVTVGELVRFVAELARPE